MREAQFQAKCLRIARGMGCLAFKFESNFIGVPDAIIIPPSGVVFFIEFKNPNGTGRVSALQERMHEVIRKNNVKVFVVASDAEFQAVMREFI